MVIDEIDTCITANLSIGLTFDPLDSTSVQNFRLESGYLL